MIDAFSEPLLDGDIPMGDFGSDMFVCFNDNRAASVDEFELLSVVRHTACMHTGDTKFPAKIVLEPD